MLQQPPDANKDIGKNALSTVDFCDTKRITLIIKVIGHMCDGQRREMQNYLREQNESIHNFNIVEELTFFLYEYSKRRVITSDSLPLITETFQSLIELCSGNYDNSKVIFNKQIVSMINYYLQIDITSIEPEREKLSDPPLRKNALVLKATVVELLEVMLEKVSSDTEELTHQIADGLDIRALHFSLHDFYVLKDDEDLKHEEADDDASRHFSRPTQ